MNIQKLDENNIPYLVKPRRSKIRGKLAMSFLANGMLSIRYSIGMNENDIVNFVEDHFSWIEKQYQKRKQQERLFAKGETYLYLGKEFRIEVYQSKHPAVILQYPSLIIYATSFHPSVLERQMKRWKDEQCEIIFNELVREAYQAMSTHLKMYPKITIKSYRNRWGCCYPNRNNIILNRSLIHVPMDLIRYVVYHELAHFVFPNHSPEFHAFLSRFMANERMMKKELAKYRADYH